MHNEQLKHRHSNPHGNPFQRKEVQAPQTGNDEFFEFFSSEQVLREFRLDPEEIRSGIVGQSTLKSAGTDGGIDAIYLLVNGRLIRDIDQANDLKSHKQNIDLDLVIVQSSLETGFGLNRFLRLKDTSENIFRLERKPEHFAEKYNDELLDVIRRFRGAHNALLTKHADIRVTYYYVTRGDSSKVEPSVANKSRELEADVKGILATVTSCSAILVGARDLISLSRKPPKSSFSLKCVDSMANKDGHVALVTLKAFKELITSENGGLREYLFESNVRDYEGEVDVNKKIKETLENQADTADFWWLNNGITIIADKIGGHTKELTFDQPRIVNGLQTSIQIFEHLKAMPDSFAGQRHVTVKLLQSDDAEQQDRIIRATNSQTKIPVQFLWATDELQRDIEQTFRSAGLHYDRRRNSWRRQSLPLDKVVGMTELAQSVAAVLLQEPDHARARPSRYFKPDQYKKIFSEKTPMPVFLNCAALKKQGESYLRSKESDQKDRNNLLFYLLMAVSSVEAKASRPSIKALQQPSLRHVPSAAFDKAYGLVRLLYDSLGADDKVAKGTDLTMKLKERLKKLHEKEKGLKKSNAGN